MIRLLKGAVAFCLLLPALLWLATWAPAPAKLVARVDWQGTNGGLSAIDVTGDEFVALSDQAELFRGQLIRDDAGGLISVTANAPHPLLDPRGHPFFQGNTDSEGVVWAGDEIVVSFEWPARISRHRLDGSFIKALPSPDAFYDLEANRSLEALAASQEGELLAIPEMHAKNGPHGWTFKEGLWTAIPPFPRTPLFRRTGADFGPDGALYVLERAFLGIGFAARVHRYGPEGRELIIASPLWQHGNLEGLSVIEAPDGSTRLIMLTDDNHMWFQRSQIVEYVLR